MTLQSGSFSAIAVDADGNGYAVGTAGLWRFNADASASVAWTRDSVRGSAIAVDPDANTFVTSDNTMQRITQ